MTYHKNYRKIRAKSSGYTVVEVMIVLAISAALFASAAVAVSGRQARTQFAQGLRQFDAQLQDVINDVSTGYYPNIGGISCGVTSNDVSGEITLDGTNTPAGTNAPCVFLGKVIHFGEAGSNNERFNVFTVVGRRQMQSLTGLAEVEDLAQAKPMAVDQTASGFSGGDSLTQNELLQWGLNITSVRNDDGLGVDIDAIGFFGSLAQVSGLSPGDITSGSQTVQMLAGAGALGQDKNQITDWIESLKNTSPQDEEDVAKDRANTAIKICLAGGANQKGSITIGGSGRQLTTTVDQTGQGC